MTNVIIVHGAYGYPGENWFPWLRQELEKKDYDVSVPVFPTPRGQSLGKWMEVVNKEKITKDTILVGHSIGCAFILKVLEKNKAKAAFLVAGFTDRLGFDAVDKLNNSFLEKGFDWAKIKNNCGWFFVYSSDNDPYVPLKFGIKLAKHLGVELIVVKGAGHFNEAAGYLKFSQLLEQIRMLK